MKMVKVIDKRRHVIIDTERTIKAFGMVLFRQRESFIKERGSKKWITTNSKRTASKKEARKLDFWLYNHKKFVTGTLES